MKRSIPKSLVSKALDQSARAESNRADQTLEAKSSTGLIRGAGSAWKSGALAQSQAAVGEAREALVSDIMNGRHELLLQPDQIRDAIGSDRRDDWQEQEPFQTLLKSIQDNGQDTPVVVLPVDANWRPDPLAPTDVTAVNFMLLTGRRRRAAAEKLGRPLRAILASPEMRKADHLQFEMLFMRFRENEERENLSAFERLTSIGEMYEHLTIAGDKLTAVAFAKRIGVHESIVSRARVAFARRIEILNAFKNAYDLSFGELQKAISSLEKPTAKPAKKVKKLTAKRKLGSRNLMLTHTNGTLSVKAVGVPVDQEQLEELSDLIADFLNKSKTAKSGDSPKLTQL